MKNLSNKSLEEWIGDQNDSPHVKTLRLHEATPVYSLYYMALQATHEHRVESSSQILSVVAQIQETLRKIMSKKFYWENVNNYKLYWVPNCSTYSYIQNSIQQWI